MSVEMMLSREYKRLGMSAEQEELSSLIVNTLYRDKWNNLALEILKELKVGSAEDKRALRMELENLGSSIEEAKAKEDKFR